MRIVLAVIGLLVVAGSACAQSGGGDVPVGSDPISFVATPSDPVANRLFVMSTGGIVDAGSIFVGTTGGLGVQGGWAPNRFMQVGLYGFYSPFSEFPSLVTAGVKVQVAQPDGYFLGLSVGADFGLFYAKQPPAFRGTLQSCNLAASFGSERISTHINLLGLPYGTSDTAALDVTYLLQTGLAVALLPEDSERGLKAIMELWLGGDQPRDIHPTFMVAGVRSYDRTFIWELGAAVGPRCFGDCDQKGLRLYPLPYAAVTIFL